VEETTERVLLVAEIGFEVYLNFVVVCGGNLCFVGQGG
jgi:hypothetical protein